MDIEETLEFFGLLGSTAAATTILYVIFDEVYPLFSLKPGAGTDVPDQHTGPLIPRWTPQGPDNKIPPVWGPYTPAQGNSTPVPIPQVNPPLAPIPQSNPIPAPLPQGNPPLAPFPQANPGYPFIPQANPNYPVIPQANPNYPVIPQANPGYPVIPQANAGPLATAAGYPIGGENRHIGGSHPWARNVDFGPDGECKPEDLLAVYPAREGAEKLIRANPNWGPPNQGQADCENPLRIFDPINQSVHPTNETFQPLARNIATALCNQLLQKKDGVWNVGILTPEMERYTASVLKEVYPEAYNRLIEGMPEGKFAFGRVQNTRTLRDALNKAR